MILQFDFSFEWKTSYSARDGRTVTLNNITSAYQSYACTCSCDNLSCRLTVIVELQDAVNFTFLWP